MINQYKISFVVKTLMVVLTLVVAGSVMAAWQDPPTEGPPPAECPGDVEGCNPPVNTGGTTQIKSGSLSVTGILGLIRDRYIDFASNLSAPSQRNANAGKMGYQLFGSRNALDIVGAGMTSSNRLVKIWDILDVQTASTTNIYARNYYVCTATGSCSPFTGGGSQWTDVTNGINYSGSRVGIRSATPLTTLDVRGNIMAAGSGSRLTMGGVDPSTNSTWHLDNASGVLRVFTQPNLTTGGSVKMTINNAGDTNFASKVTAAGDVCTTVTGTSKCLSTGASGLPAGTKNGQTLRYSSASQSWLTSDILRSIDESRVVIGSKASDNDNFQFYGTGGDPVAMSGPVGNFTVGASVGEIILAAATPNSQNTLHYNYNPQEFSIFGNSTLTGSAAVGKRKVSIYDNLNVVGTTSTRNLEICNAAGACSPVLPGTGQWTDVTNGIIYNSNPGNVGIGLDNPTKKLDISSASADGLRFRRTNNMTGFSANMGNAHPWIDFTGGLDFIADTYGNLGNWWTGKTANVILSLDATNKNVGIGTDAPDSRSKLDVNGVIWATGLSVGGSGIFTGNLVAGSEAYTGAKLSVDGKIQASDDICTTLGGGKCLSTIPTVLTYMADNTSLQLTGTTFSVKDSGISTTKLANLAVTEAKLAANSVTTTKIGNSAVTAAKLNQMGAASGQVLKWNGTAWAPAVDAGGSSYSAGTSLTLTGTTFSVTSGGITALQLASNAVETIKIRDGAVTAVKLNQMGAASGQVLKWNGSAWAPGTDNTGAGGVSNIIGGTGITVSITGGVATINNTGIRTISGGVCPTGQVVANISASGVVTCATSVKSVSAASGATNVVVTPTSGDVKISVPHGLYGSCSINCTGGANSSCYGGPGPTLAPATMSGGSRPVCNCPSGYTAVLTGQTIFGPNNDILNSFYSCYKN